MGEVDADSRWRFKKGKLKQPVLVNERYKANNTSVRLEAAINGIGIASIPTFVVSRELKNYKLVRISPEWEHETRNSGDLWMLYPASRHISAKVSKFADFLVNQLRNCRLLESIQ